MTTSDLMDPADLFAGESVEKAKECLRRYRLQAATGPQDPAFDAGYKLLHAYFGEKGEIERRSVLEGWAATPLREVAGLKIRYNLLIATDEQGDLAGARDHYAALNPQTGVCVVYLAHSFVSLAHRRSGLAALLRTAPARLGRRLLEEEGWNSERGTLILALEQEPISPDDADTVVRLAAYGRAGFRAIDPGALPYCQPDFRDLAALGVPASPIPLLAMVRVMGQEHRDTLPAAHAAAFVDHLYTVFSTHCRPADLAPARQHALDTLARAGDTVRLFVPPRHLGEGAGPLGREAVLRHFPAFA